MNQDVSVNVIAATPHEAKKQSKPKDSQPKVSQSKVNDTEKKKESQPKVNEVEKKDTQVSINSIDLRVGIIVKCEKHPSAEKLYIEEIDVGEDSPRAIASGLVPHYSLEEMQNRRLIVICNLKPRSLVGFKSHGMVLCAVKKDEDGNEKVEFVKPPDNAKPGDRIVAESLPVCDPLSPSQVDKQKAFEKVASDLIVDSEGYARWGEYKLVTLSGEYLLAPTIRDGIMR